MSSNLKFEENSIHDITLEEIEHNYSLFKVIDFAMNNCMDYESIRVFLSHAQINLNKEVFIDYVNKYI